MARHFAGNGLISVADQNDFSPTVQKITVYAKVRNPASTGQVIAKGTTNQFEWGVLVGTSTASITFWQLNGVQQAAVTATGLTLNDGKWHDILIEITYNVKLEIFVDGVSVASTITWTGSGGNGTSTVTIGQRGDGTSPFTGDIGEVAIWKTTFLTADEKTSLLNGMSATTIRKPVLVLYLPLWGLSTTEADLSGLVRNGTVTNTTVTSHPPMSLFALQSRIPTPWVYTKTITEADAFTDSVSKKVTKGITEDDAFTDTATNKKVIAVTDTDAFTDSVSKKVTKGITDSISTTDTISKKVTKPVTDASTFTDTVSKKITKGISDTDAFTDSLGKKIIIPVSDVSHFTDTVTVLATIHKKVTFKYNILNTVNKTDTIKYDILNTVTKSNTIIYDILNLVQKPVTITYDILNQINKIVIIKYDILQAITKILTAKYDILNSVARLLVVKYNLDALYKITLRGNTHIVRTLSSNSHIVRTKSIISHIVRVLS